MPNARANKTGFNIMVVIFTFVENSTLYDFSVWLSSTYICSKPLVLPGRVPNINKPGIKNYGNFVATHLISKIAFDRLF